MSWFDKLMPSRIRTEKRKHSVPEGLWVKCAGCSAQLYRAELHRNLHVCPKCGHHLRIGARERLEMFLDPESGYELAANLEPLDPLRFKDTKRYRERLNHAQRETDERDALDRHGRNAEEHARSSRPRSSFASSRARWAPSSASDSCAASRIAFSIGGRSCASRRAAGRACRKRCTRCCRWRRRAPRWRSLRPPSCRTFP